MSDSSSPLLTLGAKLRSMGPPSLESLVSRIEEMEEYADFERLVTELLPERKREILSQATPRHQIAAFASYFEDRYFPIHESFKVGDVEGYSDLLHHEVVP